MGNENGNEIMNIEFDLFWNLYDKKTGDKNACVKKWNKLKPELQKKIIDILPKWKSQFSDKQYQPFPATFLNQERYNDEIIIKSKETPKIIQPCTERTLTAI